MSLGTIIERWARERPNTRALVCEGRAVSFAELDASVNRLANGFKKLGIVKGDRVAIMLPNIPEFVYTFFSCQKLGAVAVPFNTMYKGKEILHILRDSGAKAIVCLTNSVPLINEIRSDAPELKHVITTGERTLTLADPDANLFVQAVLSKSAFADLDEAYRRIGESVAGALVELGVVDAWYRHRGSVRVGGRKIAGTLISEVEDVYIVNTICFMGKFDPTDFLYALWVPPEIKDKVVEPLTSVEEALGKRVSDSEIRDAIVANLQKQCGVEIRTCQLTREEQFGYTKQRSLARKRSTTAPIPKGPFASRLKSLFVRNK